MAKELIIDLGKIEEKKEALAEHQFESNIHSVSCTCGCSKPKWDKNNLTIGFTPNAVNKALINRGVLEYNTQKSCVVRFTDTKEPLKIILKATVYHDE